MVDAPHPRRCDRHRCGSTPGTIDPAGSPVGPHHVDGPDALVEQGHHQVGNPVGLADDTDVGDGAQGDEDVRSSASRRWRRNADRTSSTDSGDNPQRRPSSPGVCRPVRSWSNRRVAGSPAGRRTPRSASQPTWTVPSWRRSTGTPVASRGAVGVVGAVEHVMRPVWGPSWRVSSLVVHGHGSGQRSRRVGQQLRRVGQHRPLGQPRCSGEVEGPRAIDPARLPLRTDRPRRAFLRTI